jgi:pimeloyl-ACP methyl ester carboxylesterase
MSLPQQQDLVRAGLRLAWYDHGGSGTPFVFQHGLLGDAAQTVEAAADLAGTRLFTLEMRGHGRSEAGQAEAFSIATFADDLAAAMDDRGLRSAVVGGISMGAATALRLAVLRPDLVSALVLVRPAWISEAAPANLRPNAFVGELLSTMPAEAARAAFEESDICRDLARAAPDNLASLRSFFAREPQEETAALLTAIANDGPSVSRAEIARISVPALVAGCGMDAIHPLAMARELAGLLPAGRFAEVTPKGLDKARHLAELQVHIASFLGDI